MAHFSYNLRKHCVSQVKACERLIWKNNMSHCCLYKKGEGYSKFMVNIFKRVWMYCHLVADMCKISRCPVHCEAQMTAHTHTHTRTRAHARAHTHARTHTHTHLIEGRLDKMTGLGVRQGVKRCFLLATDIMLAIWKVRNGFINNSF